MKTQIKMSEEKKESKFIPKREPYKPFSRRAAGTRPSAFPQSEPEAPHPTTAPVESNSYLSCDKKTFITLKQKLEEMKTGKSYLESLADELDDDDFEDEYEEEDEDEIIQPITSTTSMTDILRD